MSPREQSGERMYEEEVQFAGLDPEQPSFAEIDEARRSVELDSEGRWTKLAILDERGREVYGRHRAFDVESKNVTKDLERNRSFREDGSSYVELGRHTLPEKAGRSWRHEVQLGPEGQPVHEIGEVESGPDRGRNWEKSLERTRTQTSEGREVIVEVEVGKILRAAESGSGSPEGHAWRIVRYWGEQGEYLGSKGETTGPNAGPAWEDGKIPELRR